MSLCRWSSMDWRCDLYIYDDVAGGYTVLVGTNRHAGPLPLGPLHFLDDSEAFAAAYELERVALDSAALVPIGGPHDGESFYGLDDDELHDLLVQLKADGYVFPDHLLAPITEETNE